MLHKLQRRNAIRPAQPSWLRRLLLACLLIGAAISHAMMRQPRDVTLSRRAARKQARREMVVQHQH